MTQAPPPTPPVPPLPPFTLVRSARRSLGLEISASKRVGRDSCKKPQKRT